MTLITQTDLKRASQAYAIANTPLFLISKLKTDPAVQQIAKQYSGEDILEHMRHAISKTPETLIDYVFPYACIVALSMKESDVYLRATGSLAGVHSWEWLDYIRRVLLQTYLPTSAAVFNAPQRVNVTVLTHSSVPVRCDVVKMS